MMNNNDEFLSRMKLFDNTLSLDKIEKARVLMVGCGAVGTSALPILVNVGIKNLVMIDIDTFEKSNFAKTSMVIKFPDDYGKPKAETVAKYGQAAMLDGGSCIGVTVNVFDLGYEFIKQFDYVISVLDNQYAKYYLNQLCIQADIPLLEGGTNGLLAIQRTYDHKNGCFGCTGEYKYETVGTGCGARYKVDVESGSIPTCQISSTIAAALIVNELVKLICNFNPKTNIVNKFYGDYGTFFSNPIYKKEDCPCCSILTKKVEDITYIPGNIEEMTVKDTLNYINELLHDNCEICLMDDVLDIVYVLEDVCPTCGKKKHINKSKFRVTKKDLFCEECLGKSNAPAEHTGAVTISSVDMNSQPELLNLSMKDIGMRYGGTFMVLSDNGSQVFAFEDDIQALLGEEFIRR